MTVKGVFLDFDGTFADAGVVPAAHVAAVRAARSAGHRVLLCTGRPRSGLSRQILDIGFDGLVCAAGGYVEVDGQVLTDRRFPPLLAARVTASLDASNGSYLLEATEAMYARPGVLAGISRAMGRELDVSLVAPFGVRDFVGDDLAGSFSKAVCFTADRPTADIAAELGDDVGCVPISLPGLGDHGGEIHLAAVDKSVGAEIAAQALGIDRADVIGVGDGANDLELVAWAGLGVAVEGGNPDLLALADRTALPPGRDGVAALFAELGLIPDEVALNPPA